MTHDTPPKRIWTADTSTRCSVGFDHPSSGYKHEYILASEADAMVAAVLREAARTGDRFIIPSLTPIMQISEMQLGRDAAAQEMQQRILALIPQPASVALDKLIAEANAALEAKVAGLVDALKSFIWWADQKCPCHNEEPNPCTLCGASVENLEPCKAADRTLPPHLLRQARAAAPTGEESNG